MDTMASNNTNTIDQLNSFLRGELAAVESYRLALEKLDNSIYRGTLLECERSHQERVRLITEAIVARGGAPVKSSGAWGAFARLIESGASMFGERAAIAALEEGEDHGQHDYRRDLDELDIPARELIQSRIIPEQRQTHDTIRNIKRQLAA
jgi:demethoxyubiquinone hydroxylase (CLK1/Coq7/Cat5 family)